VTQEVEHPLCKYKALAQTPVPPKKKKKRERERRLSPTPLPTTMWGYEKAVMCKIGSNSHQTLDL
jgi:hypothetical protein